MKSNGPPWRGEPCADHQSVKKPHSYSRSDAGRTTLISSSLSGRDWLAINDWRYSPRYKRRQVFEIAHLKAHRQQRMQQRH
jgi:hypothetical protein